jgi:hypothetical protein
MPVFHQRVIDDGTNAFAYYTKTFLDPTPAPGDTSPNLVGSIVAGSHQIVLVEEDDRLTNTAGVLTGAYTAHEGEYVLYNPTGGTFQIDAPASPVKGDRFGIKNVTTNATAMTIDGNANNIEDPIGGAIGASFGTGASGSLISVIWVFDGTNWLVQ